MTIPNRPKTLLVLVVAFALISLKALEALAFPAKSANYLFLAALDMAWLHYLSQALLGALALVAALELWRARAGWPRSAALAVVALGLHAVATTLLMLRHLEIAREAYETSRHARGLSADVARVSQLVSTGGLQTSLLVTLVLLAAGAVLIWRRRSFVRAA